MSKPFTRTFHVRWGDLDFNAHMRNTAYLDTAVDVRMMYFQEQGACSGSPATRSRRGCAATG